MVHRKTGQACTVVRGQGLQDHVVGGTLLTKRDTFLNRSQTMQLIYTACTATQVLSSLAKPACYVHSL